MTDIDTTGYDLLSRETPEIRDGDELIVTLKTSEPQTVIHARAAGNRHAHALVLLGSLAVPWHTISQIWRKPNPCPHNTLRRCFDGERPMIYFICATDGHPQCHEQFTVDQM